MTIIRRDPKLKIYILQCEKISLPPLGRISARGGRNKMGDDGKENVR